jgi:hypothetical protein
MLSTVIVPPAWHSQALRGCAARRNECHQHQKLSGGSQARHPSASRRCCQGLWAGRSGVGQRAEGGVLPPPGPAVCAAHWGSNSFRFTMRREATRGGRGPDGSRHAAAGAQSPPRGLAVPLAAPKDIKAALRTVSSVEVLSQALVQLQSPRALWGPREAGLRWTYPAFRGRIRAFEERKTQCGAQSRRAGRRRGGAFEWRERELHARWRRCVARFFLFTGGQIPCTESPCMGSLTARFARCVVCTHHVPCPWLGLGRCHAKRLRLLNPSNLLPRRGRNRGRTRAGGRVPCKRSWQ